MGSVAISSLIDPKLQIKTINRLFKSNPANLSSVIIWLSLQSNALLLKTHMNCKIAPKTTVINLCSPKKTLLILLVRENSKKINIDLLKIS
jgi:hypothetical protein